MLIPMNGKEDISTAAITAVSMSNGVYVHGPYNALHISTSIPAVNEPGTMVGYDIQFEYISTMTGARRALMVLVNGDARYPHNVEKAEAQWQEAIRHSDRIKRDRKEKASKA